MHSISFNTCIFLKYSQIPKLSVNISIRTSIYKYMVICTICVLNSIRINSKKVINFQANSRMIVSNKCNCCFSKFVLRSNLSIGHSNHFSIDLEYIDVLVWHISLVNTIQEVCQQFVMHICNTSAKYLRFKHLKHSYAAYICSLYAVFDSIFRSSQPLDCNR